jgi:AraC-like DNA-binding protein
VRLRSGTAYWLDVANPRSIAPGELLVLAPNIKAVVRASQLGEAVLNWFPFDPHLLCGFFTVEERHWFESGADGTIRPIQFLPSNHPISLDMTALLVRNPPAPEIIQRGEALVLALRVLTQNMPSPAPTSSRSAAARERFFQVISRMPDTELIEHSSEELARLCGCTARHFNRLFRARFGESPRARQTELRLLKARQLLDTSVQAVAQIAADCGYRSLSLFNSLFKRRFGMSPSEWRQSAAKRWALPQNSH